MPFQLGHAHRLQFGDVQGCRDFVALIAAALTRPLGATVGGLGVTAAAMGSGATGGSGMATATEESTVAFVFTFFETLGIKY
jgi:uncharacterized membrane-anchored protein